MKKLLLILMLALAGSGINAMNDDSDGVDPEDTRTQRWIYKAEPIPEKKADRPFDFKAFEKAMNEIEANLAKAKAQMAQEALSNATIAAPAAQRPVGRLKGMAQWIANHQKTAVLVALVGCYAGSYATDWMSAGIDLLYSAAQSGCQTYGTYPVLNSLCPAPIQACPFPFWC